MKLLKIAVIGTINKDVIVFPNKKKKISLGGIAYNICTLAALLKDRAEIYPVCNLGRNFYPQAVKFLSEFSNVKFNGMKKVSQKHNICSMYYDQYQNREEYLEGKVPVLNFKQIKPFLNLDAILINFISGWDMSLEVLQKIRKHSKGLILLDIHSLTLGIDKNKKRFLRRPKNWKAYVRCADIVQMNKTELETVLNRKLKSNGLIAEVKKILKLNPKIFLLTLGKNGAIVVWRKENKISIKKIEGIPIKKMVDNIGCGDVFGAAFLAGYLVNRNIINSAQLANHLAVKKCQFSGVEKIVNFPKMKLNFS
ncbi:MAG: hypothetical protein A2145_02110 [candidate division Zixibacteria bacterium RBG_16_40_9]|nr:MAG: hypothetical protein A2145_02110 [candidate division Zixibacteria bacterium RBG_16_40_9]